MSVSIVSSEQWPVPDKNARPLTNITHPNAHGKRSALRSALNFVGEAGLLLATVLAFPVVILLVGLPVALLVRFLLALAHWL